MIVKIRASEVKDIDGFIPVYDSDKMYLTSVAEYIKNYPAYTLLIDNKIISLGGIVNNHAATWTSWNIVAAKNMRYSKTIFKTLCEIFYRLVDDIKSGSKIIRLQALVEADRKTAIKLNEYLGFKHEAVLKKYDVNQQDIIIMTKFFDE